MLTSKVSWYSSTTPPELSPTLRATWFHTLDKNHWTSNLPLQWNSRSASHNRGCDNAPVRRRVQARVLPPFRSAQITTLVVRRNHRSFGAGDVLISKPN